MLLYCVTVTPRLQYIAAFFSKELLTDPIQLTTSKEVFSGYEGAKINYSAEVLTTGELHVAPAGLLYEEGIAEQHIECFETSSYPAFFRTSGGDFSFDLFAAAFYLLSRYEEYLPHPKDRYGRYAHVHSLAYRNNFLHLPLINIWLIDFLNALKKKFPRLQIHQRTFTWLPTYDIDIAYAYLHKGWWRNSGGLMQSLISGKWKAAADRIAVLTGSRTDPYDGYAWLDALHEQYRVKPYYFFLLAAKQQGYDKNVNPSAPALIKLIAAKARNSITGLHPSWQSGDDERLLLKEKQILENSCGNSVTHSRQHYIRMTLPVTCRRLISAGIQKDFSMGYGTINGFRASAASSFPWYDLEREAATSLIVYPFCFMDTNAYYQQQLTCREALEELMHLHTAVKNVNGLMITIWHNQFFGAAPAFAGWREVYAGFIWEVMAGMKKENNVFH